MGKRELLIALAFVAVGLVAYQLTAPPPKEGERGFSLSRIFSNVRREMRANSTHVVFSHRGTVPLSVSIEEVRLNPGRGVALTVTGEARSDVVYEMPVESTGPDEPTALEYAKRTTLKTDDLGSAVALRIDYPPEARQTASLILRVPARMMVRVDSGSRVKIKGVRAVQLGNLSGEIAVDDIAGAVSGSHRNGELVVAKAGSVNLTLVSSRAKFRDVEHGLTLNARNGECEITSSRGPLELTAMNVETTVTTHDGPVQIGGEGGLVRLNAPARDAKIDVRRAEVEVQLGTAVPLTVLTTDETLRLVLDGPPPVEIDAGTTDGGHVQATDFGLNPEPAERGFRLTHAFGPKAARVVLRNTRADIVISKRKW